MINGKTYVVALYSPFGNYYGRYKKNVLPYQKGSNKGNRKSTKIDVKSSGLTSLKSFHKLTNKKRRSGNLGQN